MIGFKGFEYNWKCQNLIYKIKEKINCNYIPVICKFGFHFCEFPLDVIRYYPILNKKYNRDNEKIKNKYAMVEITGSVVEEEEKCKSYKTSKAATNEIEILKELSLKDMISSSIDLILGDIDKLKKYFNISKNAIQKISVYTAMHKRNSISKLARSISFNGNCRSIALTTEINAYSITDAFNSISVSRSSSICNKMSSISATTSLLDLSNSITTEDDSISALTGYGTVVTLGNNSIGASVGSKSISSISSTNMLIDGNNSVGISTNNNSIINSYGDNNILITNPINRINTNSEIISSGKKSILIGMGRQGYFRGELGSIFIVPIYEKETNEIKEYVIKKVDGMEMLPNVLYYYDNGKFINKN